MFLINFDVLFVKIRKYLSIQIFSFVSNCFIQISKNQFMKTYIILLICLISSVFTFAQTTAIPDPNFEQALIDLGIDSDATING